MVGRAGVDGVAGGQRGDEASGTAAALPVACSPPVTVQLCAKAQVRWAVLVRLGEMARKVRESHSPKQLAPWSNVPRVEAVRSRGCDSKFRHLLRGVNFTISRRSAW